MFETDGQSYGNYNHFPTRTHIVVSSHPSLTAPNFLLFCFSPLYSSLLFLFYSTNYLLITKNNLNKNISKIQVKKMLVSFSRARRTNNVSNGHLLFSLSFLLLTFLPSTCGPAPRRCVPPPLRQKPLPEHDRALRQLPEVGKEQLVLFPHRQQRRLHVSVVPCGNNRAFEYSGRRRFHLPQPPHLIRGADHGFVPAQF